LKQDDVEGAKGLCRNTKSIIDARDNVVFHGVTMVYLNRLR